MSAQISKQLDNSLARLKTDYVDLYQCHRYDAKTPLEETMEALTAAVKSGKVRYIGFSEWPVDKIEAAAKREIDEEVGDFGGNLLEALGIESNAIHLVDCHRYLWDSEKL